VKDESTQTRAHSYTALAYRRAVKTKVIRHSNTVMNKSKVGVKVPVIGLGSKWSKWSADWNWWARLWQYLCAERSSDAVNDCLCRRRIAVIILILLHGQCLWRYFVYLSSCRLAMYRQLKRNTDDSRHLLGHYITSDIVACRYQIKIKSNFICSKLITFKCSKW